MMDFFSLSSSVNFICLNHKLQFFIDSGETYLSSQHLA